MGYIQCTLKKFFHDQSSATQNICSPFLDFSLTFAFVNEILNNFTFFVIVLQLFK